MTAIPRSPDSVQRPLRRMLLVRNARSAIAVRPIRRVMRRQPSDGNLNRERHHEEIWIRA